MNSTKTLLVLATLAASAVCARAAPAADAPDQNLRIRHYAMSIGKDGVQRESSHTDLMFRRAGMVWVEREIPSALREAHEHDAGHDAVHIGHAHADTTAAPLWVKRGDAGGKVQVNMVLRQQHKVIEVDEANYGNVGYGGSWANAYWVVDPARLEQMRAVGAASHGVQRYEAQQDGRTTRIDWDVAGQYPRKVERRDAHGTSLNLLTISSIAAPKTLPWRPLDDYERGDYSDLLD